MSVDRIKRIEYADVFNFDKFHEVFKHQLAIAKGGERFTLISLLKSIMNFGRTMTLLSPIK